MVVIQLKFHTTPWSLPASKGAKAVNADVERSMLPEAHSGQRSTALASTVLPLSVKGRLSIFSRQVTEYLHRIVIFLKQERPLRYSNGLKATMWSLDLLKYPQAPRPAWYQVTRRGRISIVDQLVWKEPVRAMLTVADVCSCSTQVHSRNEYCKVYDGEQLKHIEVSRQWL